MGGVGCDNMTVILVCFLHGATYAELAERCCLLSEEKDGGNGQHLSYQSKEMRTAYHHSDDPLDLRGVAKRGPGIRLNEMHPQFDGDPTSSANGLKESQQLSCTV